MSIGKRATAELIGTFWLVFGGCGSAVLAGHLIGALGVALAFGLTVLTMAYAIGHISGCHLNPAVSFGLWAGGRFPGGELLPYIIAQVLGAILGAGIIYLIAIGQPGFAIDPSSGNPLAVNGYGVHSPGGYNLLACFIAEVVMTFFFLMIILGSTDFRAPAGLAPIAIGLALTLIHLISIPITNTSVNPARSTGPALFVGGQVFGQVWLFWVAPILGALLAGWLYSTYFASPLEKEKV
ncbi:MAG: aquaporin Z [Cyanobacteriota bacterium]|nr:aquaporin Z [Cyanobacteriota bacterium]